MKIYDIVDEEPSEEGEEVTEISAYVEEENNDVEEDDDDDDYDDDYDD